jgi:hypothetical protein
MTDKETLKLALEALEGFIPYLPLNDEAQCNRYDKAITAIKEALAQPEPVAWEQFYPDIGKPQIAINSETVGYISPQLKIEGSRHVVCQCDKCKAQPEQKEKFCDSNCVWTDHHPDCNLAQSEQEPVAWMKASDTEWSISFFKEDGYVPLYTTPPQRTEEKEK